jgi:hypothetical protein
MRIIRLFALLVAVQALALAQLDPDTLTITVARNLSLQPDQIEIGISVGAPVDTSFDDVLAALAGAGITATNLNGVNTYLSTLNDSETYWSFFLDVPFAKLSDSMTALRKVQDASLFDISFYVTGPRTSQELLSSQPCQYPSLVSYAKTQAQKVAAAAGVNIGPIVGVSDSSGGAFVAAVFVAEFPSTTGGLSNFFLGRPGPNATASCTMTVQFKLLH